MTIGLTEDAQQYLDRGYKPVRQSLGYLMFRDRFGMPFSTTPRSRISATAPACRAIVATRLRAPGARVRGVQGPPVRDVHRRGGLRRGRRPASAPSRGSTGSTPGRSSGRSDSPEVIEAYEADRALARQAAGGPTEFQGKSAQTDGPVRYTAPSVIFESADGRTLEVGGFQPLEAYDVAIANLDVTLERTPAPPDPLPALERFPHGLTTQEVAAIMADGLDAPDRKAAETALIELAAAGEATRVALGDDALWRARVFDTPGAAQATAAAAHAAAAHAAAAHAAATHAAAAARRRRPCRRRPGPSRPRGTGLSAAPGSRPRAVVRRLDRRALAGPGCPRRVPRADPFRRLERLRNPWWALVPGGSIVAVVAGDRVASADRRGPDLPCADRRPGARGGRPRVGLPAGESAPRTRRGRVFVLAWQAPVTLAGEAAALVLTGLSTVTLGALLAAVAPARLLKVGIVVMALVDTALVAGDLLQAPNAVLNAASPGGASRSSSGSSSAGR